MCRRCSGEPHEPCSCQLWRQWLGHIQDMAVQVGDRTAGQLDNAASERWLATRSKPCPKCKLVWHFLLCHAVGDSNPSHLHTSSPAHLQP